MICLILAMAEDGAIGKNGTLPWHLPGDMKRFRTLTDGHTIVMGRKTFQSLPGVLPGRHSVIITRDPDFAVRDGRVTVCHDLDGTLSRFAAQAEEVFVIGGASLYKAGVKYAGRIFLTLVHTKVPDADTFFSMPEKGFRAVSRSELLTDKESGLTYEFIDYVRAVPQSRCCSGEKPDL